MNVKSLSMRIRLIIDWKGVVNRGSSLLWLTQATLLSSSSRAAIPKWLNNTNSTTPSKLKFKSDWATNLATSCNSNSKMLLMVCKHLPWLRVMPKRKWAKILLANAVIKIIVHPQLIRLQDQEAKRKNQCSDIDPNQARKEITLLEAPLAKTMWCHATSTELKVAKETTLNTNLLCLSWATYIPPKTLMKTQAL